MTLTHAEQFALYLQNGYDVVAVKLHADSMAVGHVVQIAALTGITSAPSDSDEVGIFGVLLDAGDTGDIVSCRIAGNCKAMTGDTSAIGSFVVPMADYMLNAQAVIALDGDAEDISPKPAFAKLLELGVAGELKLIKIVSQ